jgi:membrane protease YdiL (CAAX protease family)/Flp pilus assembly protein TadD
MDQPAPTHPVPGPDPDIDALCAHFEAQWRAGLRPRLEDSLGLAPEPARPELLRRLLGLELAFRRCQGESPTAEEYLQRFPGHASVIAALFVRATPEGAPVPSDAPLSLGGLTDLPLYPDSAPEREPAVDLPPAPESPASMSLAPPLPSPGFAGALGWCLLLCFLAGVALALCIPLVRALLGDVPEPVLYFVAGTLATFVAAVFLVRRLYETDARRYLALRRPLGRHVLLVVLLVPPQVLLSAEAVNWAARALGSGTPATSTVARPAPSLARAGSLPGWEEMVREMARQPWWLILLAGCLLPALGEEAFCRGFLGRGLVARTGPVLGVLLTSLLFGLLHVDPVRVCATAVGGVSLHIVYLATRSLWAPVLFHALYNALVFAGTRLAQDANFDLTGQYDAPHLAPPSVLAAGAAVLLLFFLFYRTRTRWLLPGGGEWSPGHVTAEMPPAGVEAVARSLWPGRMTLLVGAVGYLAFAGVALYHAAPGDPRSAWGYNERGNRHLDQGEFDDAIADYTEAIRLAPKDAVAYANRGLALLKKGQHAEALPDLNRAIDLDPRMANAYLSRGVVWHQLGRHDEALADYDRTLRLNPGEVLAYSNRALIRLDRRDFDGALADLDEVLRKETTAATLVVRGHVHLHKGAPEAAVRDLTEAIRLEPGNAEAFYLRGFAFQARGEEGRAQADFQEASRLDPDIRKRFR